MISRLLLGLMLIMSWPMTAAALTVSPVHIKIAPELRTITFSAINDQQDPAVIKVAIKRWTQAEGRDVLNSTESVVVYPLRAKVAPGREQIFRLMLRKAPVGPEYYRVFVDLINVAPDRAESAQLGQSFSLPVFVESILSNPVLRFISSKNGVEVQNIGDGYDFIETVEGGGGKKSTFQYVLPGSTMQLATETVGDSVQMIKTRRLGNVPLK